MINRTLEQLTLIELASIHLDIDGRPMRLADGLISSGLTGLVTEIRSARARDRTRIFSPLYGVFALLDQIGAVYVNKSMPRCPNANASGVKKALYYFCGMSLDTQEMKALWGLRNALVHDGSVLARGQFKAGRWSGPFHRFRLGSTSSQPVTLPAEAWDGKLETLTQDRYTLINQTALCDLAIAGAHEARRLLECGMLQIEVIEGEIELYYRYLFHNRR